MAIRLVVVMAVLTGVSVMGQAKPSIQGVWRVAERTTIGPAGFTNKTPQPSLYIFTARYYSTMYINGDKPRAPVEGIPVGFSAQLTDAQKLTRYNEWAAVTANSGTYTVKGNTLELHAIVAKNTAVMTSGVGGTFQLRFEGNSVWLTATTIGGVKSANPSTFRLERLE